jgi:hypothetical protein
MRTTPELVSALRKMLDDGRPIWEQLRDREEASGHAIVRVGGAPWLPAKDWHADAIVSFTKDCEVRIVLVRARQPRTGAFRRLVRGILAHGCRPVVVAPLPPLAGILRRGGWVVTEVGSTFEDSEDQWRLPDA